MATVVERPTSALNDIQANMERNSRRNSIEVIDVDEFDDTAHTAFLRPQQSPRQRASSQQMLETIDIVDDSDDEIQILPQPTRSIRPLPQGRRRMRSPPAAPVVMVPPPVPRLPRGLAAFASLPLRRPQNPSSHPAPPVRASAEPFGFERDLAPRQAQPQLEAGPSNLFNPRPPRRNPLPAAPPSHHTPAMGLGGALISSNNARAMQDALHRAAISAHTRVWANNRRRNRYPNAAVDDFLRDPEEDDMPYIRRLIGSPHEHFLQLADRLRGREPASSSKYQQSYTHPNTPEPGFTFDFALPSPEDDAPQGRFFPPTSVNAPIVIDDDDDDGGIVVAGPSRSSHPTASSSGSGSSSSKPSQITTLLVCARCLNPLPLNETLGPEDEGRRVWALRCGHMIDEKCLNEIGKPEEDEPPTLAEPTDVKGKGKAKGKQRAIVEPEPSVDPPVTAPSIRSRLRSAASSSSSSSSSSAPLPVLTPPIRPPTKRRRTNTTTSSIEAEYEWKCPVASCHREHASVKIDGIWGPEKEGKPLGRGAALMNWTARASPRGAIQVFA